MNANEPVIPQFPVLRTILAMVAIVAGVLLPAMIGLLALGASGQIPPAVGGAAVALLAVVLAILPMGRAHRGGVEKVLMMALAATGIRLFVTLLGTLALILALGFDQLAAAVWALGWYVLLLILEVIAFVRYFRSIPGAQAEPMNRTRFHTSSHNMAEGHSC